MVPIPATCVSTAIEYPITPTEHAIHNDRESFGLQRKNPSATNPPYPFALIQCPVGFPGRLLTVNPVSSCMYRHHDDVDAIGLAGLHAARLPISPSILSPYRFGAESQALR
jgi:hypothetical protein